MKKLFSKFTREQFRVIAPVLGFSGDIVLCSYLYYSFSLGKERFKEAFELAQKMNPQAGMPDEFIEQLFPIMLQSLAIMFIAYLLLHGIVYLCFYLKKRFAIVYIRPISWIAVVGAILIGIGAIGKGFPVFAAYFFLQSFFFLFIALGIKHYGMLRRPDEEATPTPMQS